MGPIVWPRTSATFSHNFRRRVWVPAFAGTTKIILAARFARALQIRLRLLKEEGAGNAGCALHPRSRVPKVAQLAHTSIQVSGEHSDIPCATALRLISCSPRWSGLVVTVTPEKLASRELSASIAAPGPHDFAVRGQRFVECATRVHRISSQRTVTTADAPLRDETARFIILICRNGKRNIFYFGA